MAADEFGDLDKAANAAEDYANNLLKDELNKLRSMTRANLGALKPQGTDPADYDRLIAAVEASTRANESNAQLQRRLKGLGEGVAKLAKKIASAALL